MSEYIKKQQDGTYIWISPKTGEAFIKTATGKPYTKAGAKRALTRHMQGSPFVKAESADDHLFLSEAWKILKKGDHLYGLTPDDTQHIHWAISGILDQLKTVISDDHTICISIELGADIQGFSIRFVKVGGT